MKTNKSKNQHNENSKHAGGRPSTFSPEIAATICERLAEGESLRKITSDSDMPSMYTVYVWMGKHPEFANQYARAREDQADTLADEILHIADTEPDANKARVQIDARKWVASKLKPKKYGDSHRLDLNANPIEKIPTKQLEAIVAEHEAKVIAEYEASKRLAEPDAEDAEIIEDEPETAEG